MVVKRVEIIAEDAEATEEMIIYLGSYLPKYFPFTPLPPRLSEARPATCHRLLDIIKNNTAHNIIGIISRRFTNSCMSHMRENLTGERYGIE